MPFHQKKLVFVLGTLVIIGGVFSIIAWKQSENRKPSPTNEPVIVAPYNELVSSVGGKTIKNTKCNLTFKIPADWSVGGLFGGTTILSPEDQHENEEWDKTHQDLIQNEEGDAPLGPDARSLSISCQNNIKNYLSRFSASLNYKVFENAKHLAEALATSAFHAKDSNVALLKTMKVGGWDAYEISWTVKMPDDTSNTTYEILVEKGDIYQIHLGQTEYSNLSDTVKDVINSISFEDSTHS